MAVLKLGMWNPLRIERYSLVTGLDIEECVRRMSAVLPPRSMAGSRLKRLSQKYAVDGMVAPQGLILRQVVRNYGLAVPAQATGEYVARPGGTVINLRIASFLDGAPPSAIAVIGAVFGLFFLFFNYFQLIEPIIKGDQLIGYPLLSLAFELGLYVLYCVRSQNQRRFLLRFIKDTLGASESS